MNCGNCGAADDGTSYTCKTCGVDLECSGSRSATITAPDEVLVDGAAYEEFMIGAIGRLAQGQTAKAKRSPV